MDVRRVVVGCSVTAVLFTSTAIGAPAQGESPRQQWSLLGMRVVSPALDFEAIPGERMRLKIVSTRDETVEIEAAAFRSEPTATGFLVRARGKTRVIASGGRASFSEATFEMTMSREGVVNMWAAGNPVR